MPRNAPRVLTSPRRLLWLTCGACDAIAAELARAEAEPRSRALKVSLRGNLAYTLLDPHLAEPNVQIGTNSVAAYLNSARHARACDACLVVSRSAAAARREIRAFACSIANEVPHDRITITHTTPPLLSLSNTHHEQLLHLTPR